MNYSQRTFMERLMLEAPNPDPFGLGVFAGIKIVESPDLPRYVLPLEVIPGVPWPPGFRDEINQWSRAYLGTTNMVPPGVVYMIGGTMAVMRPRDAALLVNSLT